MYKRPLDSVPPAPCGGHDTTRFSLCTGTPFAKKSVPPETEIHIDINRRQLHSSPFMSGTTTTMTDDDMMNAASAARRASHEQCRGTHRPPRPARARALRQHRVRATVTFITTLTSMNNPLILARPFLLSTRATPNYTLRSVLYQYLHVFKLNNNPNNIKKKEKKKSRQTSK